MRRSHKGLKEGKKYSLRMNSGFIYCAVCKDANAFFVSPVASMHFDQFTLSLTVNKGHLWGRLGQIKDFV